MWPIAACSKSRSIIALRGAGQFIGEVLLFDNTGRDAPMGSWQTCVRARTDVHALILTVKDLKELVTRKPAAEVELRAGQSFHWGQGLNIDDTLCWHDHHAVDMAYCTLGVT